MESTSALKTWVKAGVKTGESEGCCFFVLFKMEDVQEFFEEEQNEMILSFQQMLTPFGQKDLRRHRYHFTT